MENIGAPITRRKLPLMVSTSRLSGEDEAAATSVASNK